LFSSASAHLNAEGINLSSEFQKRAGSKSDRNLARHRIRQWSICGLFVWLVADGWCWFVLREKYCWLVAGDWFGLREKY
jgi:hypothetical protein